MVDLLALRLIIRVKDMLRQLVLHKMQNQQETMPMPLDTLGANVDSFTDSCSQLVSQVYVVKLQ
jgi:hypothetical protein